MQMTDDKQPSGAETITHLAFHAGWPNGFSAIGVAKQVFRGN
jgi:alkylhydroperoxidase/carboxymuconolactone decarboxylase family protein YurZ